MNATARGSASPTASHQESFRPVSGLTSGLRCVRMPRTAPSRAKHSGVRRTKNSLTVAGAAPALQCDVAPRTGFPFHPLGDEPVGTPEPRQCNFGRLSGQCAGLKCGVHGRSPPCGRKLLPAPAKSIRAQGALLRGRAAAPALPDAEAVIHRDQHRTMADGDAAVAGEMSVRASLLACSVGLQFGDKIVDVAAIPGAGEFDHPAVIQKTAALDA